MIRPVAIRPLTRAIALPRAGTASVAARFYGTPSSKKDDVPSPAIVTEKGHELDVQSHSSAQANRERKASSESPEKHGPRQDPKSGHPKAPEPVIGMQDERGAKGQP